MDLHYSSYKVEIKNLKYITDDGRKFPRTAIVAFFNEKGEESGTELFGNLEIGDIYNLIDNGAELNLDNCYIEDFSLSYYRQHSGIEKKQYVRLNSFSAKKAFFEAHLATDFTFADFGDSGVSFEESQFAKGRVLFNNAKFGKGDVSFSGIFVRDGHIEFTGSAFGDGDFIFKNVIVKDGLKDFQDITFGAGEVTFANSEFNSGDLLFINTHFGEGKFIFKITRITSGRVDFHYSTFGNGDVVFERAEFGDSRVDFRAVDFGDGRVNFNRSIFGNGDITFEGATFEGSRFFFKRVSMGIGNKDFSLMEMKEAEIDFEKTEFGNGALSFNTSKFKVLSLRSCHLDHYVDLRIAGAEELDLSDSIVRDIVDLEPYNADVNIRILNLSGMRLLGKLYLDWMRNNCKEAILEQESTDLQMKAEQFRILKENYNVTGKYDDEDRAYVMFKRLEAKAVLIESRKTRKGFNLLASYLNFGFRWLVFDAAGQYATNPVRVLVSMGVSYIVFSLIYLFEMLFTRADIIASVNDNLSQVARAFYHSAITFLTIGYGDHYPFGAIRWMSGIEGFVGLFLMSYFTVAFVRKILR
ncbi:MAG TPA: potassium channel family protein [Bacteroidales bacterium]|nr:potassium channel family protein [Bacteroidales bacterium]